MTEQPDTAAIRATYADDAAEFPGGTAWQFMRLADALDAARAESEALRREQIHAVRLAEAAEARIGAALAAYGNGLGRAAMYRALTGDTP